MDNDRINEHAEACRLVIAHGACIMHDDIICCNSDTPTDGETTFKCPGDKWDCHEKVAEATAWLIAHGFEVPA